MVLLKTEWTKGRKDPFGIFFTNLLHIYPCRFIGVFYILADGSK